MPSHPLFGQVQEDRSAALARAKEQPLIPLCIIDYILSVCPTQVQEDRSAALARAKETGFIDDYTGWRK